MGPHALSAESAERLLALLIINLKPLTPADISRSAALRCVRWSGRRLACPVGLLGGQCDRRSSAAVISCTGACWFKHAVRLVFSCNCRNWKWFNSLTSFATNTVRP